MAEIIKYQNTTETLIPKASFQRLVKEILTDLQAQMRQPDRDLLEMEDHPFLRMEIQALYALQEAAEQYLVGLMEDGYLCSVHGKRVTLMEKDLHLVNKLRVRKLTKVVKTAAKPDGAEERRAVQRAQRADRAAGAEEADIS